MKSATFHIYKRNVTGIKNYEDRYFYTEKDGTDHYIMSRHGSPAGEYYNELTIELIKRKYNDCKVRRKIDIPEEITVLFSNMSKDITEDNIEIKNLHISEDKTTITMNDENKKNQKKNNIRCQGIIIDEMGKYNSISNKYIPKFSYYAYKEKENYILLIRLELPGNIDNLTASYLRYGKKNTIKIKGNKSKDEFSEMKKKNFIEIQDKTRSYGELTYFLELEQEIELMRETPIEKTQIYEIEFNRNNIDPSFSSEDNDEKDEDEENDEEIEKANDKKEEKVKIASGVYILKFYLTQTSWKKLNKKYKKPKGENKINK